MKNLLILITLILLTAGFVVWKRRLRKIRRRALLTRPFPAAWRTILEQNMPLYTRLPDALK
ncbi:MAG: hypothetical protein R3231_11380, partial [bacterium]|nr:hypothetical protein [bacterium]